MAGLLTLLLWHPALPAKKARYISITPSKGTPVAVVTDEKIGSYFLCSPHEPLELSLIGPGTLEITTRLLLPKGKTEGSYAVELREGSTFLERHETQSQAAMAKLSGRSEGVCKSRKFHYAFPSGPHRLTLSFISGDYPAVAARFALSVSKEKKEAYVAIAPLSYARSATIVIKEKSLTYYVAQPSRPVTFRVLGPARLKVVSRLAYDPRMKGAQKYSVTVTEEKKLLKQFPLETTKSSGLSFGEWPEVTPGKSRTFYFDIPEGEHHYDFGISGGMAKGVAFLFALPQGSLSNEN